MFGQNWICNCRDITDMDKCRQDKCRLDKCSHGIVNMFNMVLGTYHLGLVKIGPVTAEILLTLSLRWWVVVGVQRHFRVKPNVGYVRLN